MRTTGDVVDGGRCGGRLGCEGRSGPYWIASAAALSCCTASLSRSQRTRWAASALTCLTWKASSTSGRSRPPMAVVLVTQFWMNLSVRIFLVAQEPTLWPMEWGPPGLFAAGRVAPDLDVSVACVPGRGTVTRLPGDRDSARFPGMVQTALSGPGRTGHPASRTHTRLLGFTSLAERPVECLPTADLFDTRAVQHACEVAAQASGLGSGVHCRPLVCDLRVGRCHSVRHSPAESLIARLATQWSAGQTRRPVRRAIERTGIPDILLFTDRQPDCGNRAEERENADHHRA